MWKDNHVGDGNNCDCNAGNNEIKDSSNGCKMDMKDVLSKLVKPSYIQQSLEAIDSREKKIFQLFEKRKVPERGWDDLNIEMLLSKLSLMDSNNFMHNLGVGERESRFLSDIVAKRHFRFGHGIGRSGDIAEVQPKATGSSLLYLLVNSLVLDMLKKCGVPSTKICLIVPLATGMSLTLCLLTLRHLRKEAKYVLWPRIDQKSCFKSIIAAGFEPIVIENKIEGDAIVTDLDAIQKEIDKLGAEKIVSIISTTSCFAPRHPDSLIEISQLSSKFNIPHLVNNAYGIQSSKCMHLIEQASQIGRIDAYIQSTDKNFLVPVGGAIIAAFDSSFISSVSKTYPGRGSFTPSLDVLITLLHLGVSGYKQLLFERKKMFKYFKNKLSSLAEKHNEKVLETKCNTISLGVSLSHIKENETRIGSMLFLRGVSGARVVSVNSNLKNIANYEFKNWPSHINYYPCSYLTVAAAIGISKHEIDQFLHKLDQLFTVFKKKQDQNLIQDFSTKCQNFDKKFKNLKT